MSDDLKLNKILGAGLATVLVILGVREISSHIFAQEPLKKDEYPYAVAVQEEAGGAGAEVDNLPDWGTVLPTADVAAGEKTFAKCTSCHNNANGGPNAIGPNLWAVVGRATASHPGFDYSAGMKGQAAKSANWTYDQLYQFLKGPQAYVAGTKMTFVGVKPAQDRINLIAYLRSQGSTGYPIPPVDPKRAPGAATPAGAAGTTTAPGAATGQGGAGTTPAAGAAATSTPPAAKPGAVAGTAAATPAPAAAAPAKK